MQRADFDGIFKAMDGLPVTIRLLDPPLHEFLPHTDEEIREVAQSLGVEPGRSPCATPSLPSSTRCSAHRGCRLGVTFPEIYETQVARDYGGGL